MAKIQRNDPCPCGSGKKYKQCCLVTQPVIPPTIATPPLHEGEGESSTSTTHTITGWGAK